MNVDMANKVSNMTRCTNAVRNARDKMRILSAENKELKKANYSNHKMDKTKRRQEEEIKTKDERQRRAENDKKELADNIAALK